MLVASMGLAWGAPAAGGVHAVARTAVKLEVLGIRIGMKEADAQRRLARLGTRRELENEETESAGGASMERELWTLRSTAFGFVQLGIGEDGRVVAIQAHARRGQRAMRYRDIGDPADAWKLGYYIFLWTTVAGPGTPALRVEARGTDPEYLGSYSIVRAPR